MPKVKIQKKLSISAKDLFAAVKDVLTNDKEIKALEPNLEISDESIDGDKMTAKVNGSRVTGNFCITSQGEDSTIDVDLKLPLMLAPFKGLVQKKIEEKLAKIS